MGASKCSSATLGLKQGRFILSAEIPIAVTTGMSGASQRRRCATRLQYDSMPAFVQERLDLYQLVNWVLKPATQANQQ